MYIFRYLILIVLTFLFIIWFLPAVNATLLFTSHHTALLSSIPNSPLNLLEEGKLLYDRGEFANAAAIWEQSVKQFAVQEQRYQADAYRYLAIVYQDLGQWEAAKKAIKRALEISGVVKDKLLIAQVFNTQAKLQLNLAQTTLALETWKQAESIYRSLEDTTGVILTQINQAQALQNLGFYRRARILLEQVNQNIKTSTDTLVQIKVLRSLGIALEVIGDLEESQAILSKSLALSQKINDNFEIGENLLSLGNTLLALENFVIAEEYYEQAAINTNSQLTQLEAQVNQFNVLTKTKQNQKAYNLIPEIEKHLSQIQPSRAVIYAQVNFANSLMTLWLTDNKQDKTKIATILATALQQAKELKDPVAESRVMGELGHLYEQNQQYSEALNLTQKALNLSENLQASEISVNLYWQQGRILKIENDISGAITSYNVAINTIESLRQDLIAPNSQSFNKSFYFRQRVEPIYRQTVELLLQNLEQLPEAEKQQRLEKSRMLIESLQLRELENFFRAACLDAKQQKIDQIDQNAVVIYPILLEKKIEVILSIPGKSLQHYSTNISETERIKLFQEIRKYLNPVFKSSDILPAAQKSYDLLLRPAEKYLANQNIKTLVFVLDGYLRNLPMGVLHDGKQYLIEKYAIALTPGLQLLPARPLILDKFETLTAGLTDARQGFSPLPGVETEITQITKILPAKVLINKTFTESNVEKQIQNTPFSVLHFATHGQFSSQAKNTFLLTWDGKINVNDVNRLLQRRDTNRPIELLVLSACKTAKGDDKATLGLAGIAVRSGVRSTLATLWSVRDKSTAQVITKFYQQIMHYNYTKAEALRQAQLSLLKNPQYQHPYYWSPFVLVGNWN
ncbi:hypothetical protein RIVM261_039460 [Rivularia sp. IAM M-261]|nr:hypothetical protein CAL7716_078600 [Calothrix sp. PCC 7716]GJD18990.1 hypothetical protein RIVM261_039460 [Rivularia sp. IAM M-261]